MSNLLNRSTARVIDPETMGFPLVPLQVRALYAEVMAQIPRVRLNIRSARRSADLPAVQSFG